MIWLTHTTLRYRDCTGPHARTYCARQHATATASYRRALHNGVACVLVNQSQAWLQTGAVASCMLRPVHMLRPVWCGGQCDKTGVRAVHKRRSVPHAKYGFVDVKHQPPHQPAVSNSFTVIAATSSLSLWLRYACWPLERNLKLHEWHNPVNNLKCCATMVLESHTTFLCTVSFARRQVENPLATGQNCQAITWYTKSGLLSERKRQYYKS
jgi:hypothetical protein